MATPSGRRGGGLRPARSAAGRSGAPGLASRSLIARRALITLAEAATAGLTAQEMLELVVAAAGALAGEATVHLWLVDDARQELRLVAECGARPGRARVPLRPVMRLGEGLAGAVARNRKPLVLPSLQRERRFANPEWARDQGFVSFAGVPFARADRLLGVLCLFTWRRHRFTPQDVELLRSFASHAAVALESAALLEAATSRLRRLETLREIEREISQQHDVDALLGLIVQRATELLEAHSATVFLLDETGAVLRDRASFNLPIGLRGIVVPLGEGVAGRVAERREGMIVNDYPRSPYAIAPFRDLDAAVLAQPLLHSGTLHGVILVRRQTAGHGFASEDLVQLGDFAVQASIALENVRLLRLASTRAERVKAAAEVGRLLVSTLDADRILDVIADKCREILGAQAFGLFRADPDGRLGYARGFGFAPAFMQAHVLAVGEGVVGKAATERRSVQTADLLRDPAITLSPAARARIEREGSRALVAVPILVRNEVLGVLAVYQPPGFRIPAEETEFLEMLASHAGAALENARLFAQQRRRQEAAETLAALTQTLTGTLDLSRVMELVADGIRRLLGSDGGSIGVVEPDGTLRVLVGVGLGTETYRDLAMRPGQGIGGWVLEHGEPFWTADYLHDPRITQDFAPRVRLAGVVGVLAVPVRLRDEIVAVLWASYGRPVQVTREEIDRATDLARVVAIAVANARLYAEARQRESQARALFEVGRLTAATLEPDRVLELILEKVQALMRVPACGIFRLDEQGGLHYAGGTGLSARFLRDLSVRLGEGTSGQAVVEGVPVWTADILADPSIRLSPATRALIESEGYRAVLSVPIWVKEAPYGCLAAYWWEPHEATTAEIETLSSLAILAAVALENARLYGEAREHLARLETLNQVNRAVSASLRVDDVLQQVALAAGSLFGALLVTVWVADEERRLLTRRAGSGDPDLLARIPDRVAYGEAGVGWVAEHRQPLLDVAVEGSSRVPEADWAVARGITSFSEIPMLLGDRLLGVMAIGGRRESPLSPADVALLETLLGQAAVAIQNARLYEEAQRQEAEAVALAEASRRFGTSLRHEAVFDLLREVAGQTMGGSWGVLLLEPATGALRVVAPAAPLEGPDGLPIWQVLGDAHGAQVLATGAPLLVRATTDLPADQPLRAALEARGLRSVLLVPMSAGGMARGILAGAVDRAASPLAERDVRLAVALAERASSALENARLFEELARAYQELKTAQDHLIQTEKLRALGEMASGVAHDFNNILAAILGRVQLMLTRVEDPSLQQWLQIVERAALDGAQTVRKIQEFTRIRRDTPAETVDLTQVVHDAVEMTQTRWREEPQSQGLDIEMVLDLQPVPAVGGHPAELRQMLTNLILNAVDALPRGGTITVATRTVDEDVEVTVADTGVGMADEVRRRIFEPFFSTKGVKGTGLGLAMVYGIVSRHRGQISVDSREGAGSTFRIRLPVGIGAAGHGPGRVPLAAFAGVRILVIDDEETVRDALAEMLRLAGCEVVVASQGYEGLERFRAESFDLVMTDLAMPGMSGWQVAQTTKGLHPEVPVVLVTGWGVELPAERLLASGVDRVMTKPFEMDEVHRLVGEFLGRPPGAREDPASARGRRG